MRFLRLLLLVLIFATSSKASSFEEGRAFMDKAAHQAISRFLRPSDLAHTVISALRLQHRALIEKKLFEAEIPSLDDFLKLVRRRSPQFGLLSAEQAAATLQLYLTLQYTENRLWRRDFFNRSQMNRLFNLVQVIDWSRTDGDWEAFARPFYQRKLKRAFVLLQAARLNDEPFSGSSLRLKSLFENFCLNLQAVALGHRARSADPQMAMKALSVFLASSKLDDNDGAGKFIRDLSQRPLSDAMNFFADGSLPAQVRIPDSVSLKRLIEFFRTHPRDQSPLESLRRACH